MKTLNDLVSEAVRVRADAEDLHRRAYKAGPRRLIIAQGSVKGALASVKDSRQEVTRGSHHPPLVWGVLTDKGRVKGFGQGWMK